MICPKCGHELKSPVAVAGGKVGGKARVPKGFAMGQPSTEARKRAWETRRRNAVKRMQGEVW